MFPRLPARATFVADINSVSGTQKIFRPRQTRTHCCGHIVAQEVSWAAQTGKHLLRTQNISEQNQKQFLCPGHKICVRNKCCARGQTGKHLCRQQCVRINVSSFARAFSDFVQKHVVSATNVFQFALHGNTTFIFVSRAFARPRNIMSNVCVRNNVSSFAKALINCCGAS